MDERFQIVIFNCYYVSKVTKSDSSCPLKVQNVLRCNQVSVNRPNFLSLWATFWSFNTQVFGKSLNLLNAIGQILIVVNAQKLNKYPSHKVTLSPKNHKKLSILKITVCLNDNWWKFSVLKMHCHPNFWYFFLKRFFLIRKEKF